MDFDVPACLPLPGGERDSYPIALPLRTPLMWLSLACLHHAFCDCDIASQRFSLLDYPIFPTMPNRDGIMPLTKGYHSRREKAALPSHLAKEARMRESPTLRFGWLTTQTTGAQETGWVAVLGGGGAVVANCVQGPIRTHRLMVNGCLCDWGSGEETGKRHKQSKDRHRPNTHAFGSLSTAFSACSFCLRIRYLSWLR